MTIKIHPYTCCILDNMQASIEYLKEGTIKFIKWMNVFCNTMECTINIWYFIITVYVQIIKNWN